MTLVFEQSQEQLYSETRYSRKTSKSTQCCATILLTGERGRKERSEGKEVKMHRDILFLVLMLWTSFVNCCSTNNGSCIFPFIYKSKTYHGCTRDEDPDSRLWCSLQVDDETGVHVTGQFGHCQDDCIKHPVCDTLSVTDTDDDFASGEYVVGESY